MNDFPEKQATLNRSLEKVATGLAQIKDHQGRLEEIGRACLAGEKIDWDETRKLVLHLETLHSQFTDSIEEALHLSDEMQQAGESDVDERSDEERIAEADEATAREQEQQRAEQAEAEAQRQAEEQDRIAQEEAEDGQSSEEPADPEAGTSGEGEPSE